MQSNTACRASILCGKSPLFSLFLFSIRRSSQTLSIHKPLYLKSYLNPLSVPFAHQVNKLWLCVWLSMADMENVLHPSKKRAAGREISKDNPGLDDEDIREQETGTFLRASDEVLANRRIVKVRRHEPPTMASSNPFTGIKLMPPVSESGVKPAEVTKDAEPVGDKPTLEEVSTKEDGDKQDEKKSDVTEPYGKDENDTNGKDEGDKQLEEEKIKEPEPASDEKKDSADQATDHEAIDEKEAATGEEANKDNGHTNTAPSATATLNSFQQLSSSQNAFTGFTGTGFSGSSFSFGTIGAASGSTLPTFNFSNTSSGSSSLFGTSGSLGILKSEGRGVPPMKEVPVQTGEENEKVVYSAESALFEYVTGGWKERGKGEVKVNLSTAGDGRGRLVMRAKGNYRLILNARLYPDMMLKSMDKRGITFACMNTAGEGKDGLSTFALKFKDSLFVEEFRAVVNLHKGEKTTVTPEKSTKSSDE